MCSMFFSTVKKVLHIYLCYDIWAKYTSKFLSFKSMGEIKFDGIGLTCIICSRWDQFHKNQSNDMLLGHQGSSATQF